jgi:2-C-methyl-D-erythritol 4-phosphate cytidylyltransferase
MIAALIVAAGKGVRMGMTLRKQYLPLGGVPILAHTLKAFDACARIEQLVVVVPGEEMAFCRHHIMNKVALRAPVQWVAGGTRRQDSVCNGLEVLSDEGIVLIHDGVRPLVSSALIASCIEGAQRWKACIPVVKVTDTLKAIDGQDNVLKTVSRQGLGMAQTPQGFEVSLIKQAHRAARLNGWEATDDASLIERAGGKVHTIAGSPVNIKITIPEDLRWAEAMLALQIDP